MVHDVSHFVQEHPGGDAYLRANYGRDATAKFNGVVYKHSTAARNILAGLRVARLLEQPSD